MHRILILVFVALALAGSAAHALDERDEIEHLISYIEKSDVRFIRAGTEYSSQEGAAHIRQKLARAGRRVKTAEDFVTGLASKSYLTGSVYMVKMPDGQKKPAGPWLAAALANYRQQPR